MPIYEYACKKCGKVVEVFQKVTDKGPAKCEKCGGKLERVLSHTSFQLKGGGWYKDLYASVKPGASDGEGSISPPVIEKNGKSEKPDSKDAGKPGTSDANASAKPEAREGAKAESKPSPEAKSSAKPEAKKAAEKTKKASKSRD